MKKPCFGIRNLLGPEQLSALGVHRNQIIISGAADDFSVGERRAAVGMNVVGIARHPLIGPQYVAVGGVHCDGVMVARYVHDARGNDGRRFGGHFFRNRVRADFRELLHIARRDLSQRAVARSVEIVIRVGPIPVFGLGRTRGKSYSAKATDGPERDRQHRDEKQSQCDRSEGAARVWLAPLLILFSSIVDWKRGSFRCGNFPTAVDSLSSMPQALNGGVRYSASGILQRDFKGI